jgi:hypothetical protein
MAHSGTVDKFIGDAIMAIWNAPADDPDHAANACAATLAFLRANDRLNDQFREEGWPSYHTRCGLHTGPAVVGNIGSEDRMNYTALGATVNLAARLEGLNKNYGTQVWSRRRCSSAWRRVSCSGASTESAPRDLARPSRSTNCGANATPPTTPSASSAGIGIWSTTRFATGRRRPQKSGSPHSWQGTRAMAWPAITRVAMRPFETPHPDIADSHKVYYGIYLSLDGSRI